MMKKPFGAFTPKRGQVRALKRPTSSMTSKRKPPPIAYVQHNEKKAKVTKWCVTVEFLLHATDMQVIEKLRSIGWISWAKVCPHCGTKLRFDGPKSARLRRNSLSHIQPRCPTKRCHRRIPWTVHHPLLHQARRGLTIGQQAAVYLCILLGCNQHAISIQLGISRKTVQLFCFKLKTFIADKVTAKQDTITYVPDDHNWPEVEVDEVTLSKNLIKKKQVRWGNYIGMVRRGLPTSLWIQRLPDRTTGIRSLGPGPLRLADWDAIATKMIANKGVVLHSDSARAYMHKYPRVAQTRVVHCKKWIRGSWKRPFYTKITSVKCDKFKKKVVAGTQIIDGIWRLLRKGKWGCHGGEEDINKNIRWVHSLATVVQTQKSLRSRSMANRHSKVDQLWWLIARIPCTNTF